jgi:formate hydrogenlyase subunit 6/NADH:ubiquinone oxidoreductase subunit I
MNSIAEKAKQLLDNKTADVVIGYCVNKSGKSRPVFITDSSATGQLDFNQNCTQNLAVYLTKHEVKHMGKMAIIATIPVMRSILMLISERQLTSDQIVVIGIGKDEQILDFENVEVMQNFVDKTDMRNPEKDRILLENLSKMNLEERFGYWENELSKCIKCYACRQACPMCYCNRCAVECNQPQWIPVQANPHGNFDWHILRAMHLAGRCISCGQCGDACPVDIPCHLLTMHMVDTVHEKFGVYAGTSEKMDSVLSSYKPNDKETFII